MGPVVHAVGWNMNWDNLFWGGEIDNIKNLPLFPFSVCAKKMFNTVGKTDNHGGKQETW